MNFLLNQTCYLQYRIQTFDKSPFEKIRGKCSPKRLAEAGFYYAPDQPADHNDLVRCYACGVELYGWNRGADDPWNEHVRENPECFYLEKKKSYANELTVLEFIEIEKYRYLRLNDNLYNTKKAAILEMLDKLNKMSNEEIQTLGMAS